MYCIVNDDGDLEVHTVKDDLCFKCKHIYKCPLLQAIQKEYVFMHYSDIEVQECALFRK